MLSILISLFLLLFSISLNAAPRVVVSIEPLAEISAQIMKGAGRPEVIIGINQDPHHFALKPSHIRKLQSADLVIWIDEHFESGFNRVPEILNDSTRQLMLTDKIELPERHFHFWYSPDYLKKATSLISATLSKLDPAYAELYQNNANRQIQLIDTWEESQADFFKKKDLTVITDHDFLSALTDHFGLAPLESVHDQHDQAASIKQVQYLTDYLKSGGTRCLLTLEPSLSKMARNLTSQFKLDIINVSPVGLDSTRPKLIFKRLDRLSKALQQCS
ncbi:MAG: zinc transport system substrate-binding protein [Gammaproteobacteria bacterium]|jgi:zinc transport system substrate-binding protein